MRQQRGRRYKSAYENKKWDTNAISPGTFFMNLLNHHLKEFKKGLKALKCIVSDSNERKFKSCQQFHQGTTEHF